MGLSQLEWHAQKDGGWVARVAIPYDTNDERVKYRRFAHVNVFDWVGYLPRQANKGKVPLQFQQAKYGPELIWFDSVEAAKVYAEAIFALDY